MKRPTRTQSKSSKEVFGLSTEGWLSKVRIGRKAGPQSANFGTILYLGHKSKKTVETLFKGEVAQWQLERPEKVANQSIQFYSTQRGPLWVIKSLAPATNEISQKSHYGAARDLMGEMPSRWGMYLLKDLVIKFVECDAQEVLGGLVGLEMGSYLFNRLRAKAPLPKASKGGQKSPAPCTYWIEGVQAAQVEAARHLGVGVNIARHLANLPADELTPESYALTLEKLFRGVAGISVSVWRDEKLVKEKMGLLMAVGRGAKVQPRLVHLRYRPKASGRSKKPIAFVGKGITFDSGGLDLKPSDGMRLMKKDMGGSAALAGLAWWLTQEKIDQPCDFYLALAENAVSDRSFRPGDVFRARNGQMVEIHNTDAEGRLVLADAIDVALSSTGADEPKLLIDVATLTGAIKVALGADIAGLFSNNDRLATRLCESGLKMCDRIWRMPLYQSYANQLVSNFADFSNASPGRFGGAITAALFLEKFVKQCEWAHLDIYAWTDIPQGALREAGGSGQAVQLLAGYLKGPH